MSLILKVLVALVLFVSTVSNYAYGGNPGSTFLEKRVEELESRVHMQAQMMETLLQRLNTQDGVSKSVQAHVGEVARNGQELADLDTDDIIMDKGYREQAGDSAAPPDLKRLVLDGGSSVAFHAVIDRDIVANLSINGDIVFDVVVENLGGGYSNKRGSFFAPAPGVYLFSASILSNSVDLGVSIKKDGLTLASAYAHGETGGKYQGSVTVVTKLIQGNTVTVTLSGPNHASLYGHRYTSFTGCRINTV